MERGGSNKMPSAGSENMERVSLLYPILTARSWSRLLVMLLQTPFQIHLLLVTWRSILSKVRLEMTNLTGRMP